MLQESNRAPPPVRTRSNIVTNVGVATGCRKRFNGSDKAASVLACQGPVLSAAFSPDGKRVVTASDDQTARLRDVSRSEAVVRGRELVFTAALAQNIGWRMANERQDILMQDAPDDMFSAALALLGDRAVALAETVAALHAPIHPNCYLSATEFAAKFGARFR